MTNRLSALTAPVGELTAAEQARRERAAAPTLRDLQPTAQVLLPSAARAETSGARPGAGSPTASP